LCNQSFILYKLKIMQWGSATLKEIFSPLYFFLFSLPGVDEIDGGWWRPITDFQKIYTICSSQGISGRTILFPTREILLYQFLGLTYFQLNMKILTFEVHQWTSRTQNMIKNQISVDSNAPKKTECTAMTCIQNISDVLMSCQLQKEREG
jgi:hypothetical protein